MTRQSKTARRGRIVRVEQEPQPIWMAVLLATGCQAVGNGRERAVRWEWVAGRAVYTNTNGESERIEPLGATVRDGDTLAVYWAPGETTYTLEMYRQRSLCVA